MDKNSIRKIIENKISNTTGDKFQDFCDRFCLEIYPNDYTPVRAGGRNGDEKNDGYCPKARIFFQAFGIRNGENAKRIKKKIEDDFNGCLDKHPNVQKWIFLTNQTLIGEIETFIDELRVQNPNITIETWGHLKISDKISELDGEIISKIIDINFPGITEEQELSIIDNIFEDVLQNIKERSVRYTYTTNVNLDEKLKINFSSEQDREEVKDYLKYSLAKLPLINERMEIEESSVQDDIHTYIVGLYYEYRRKGVSNIEILISLFNDIIPSKKKDNLQYQNLGKAFVLFFFDDCTIFEKTQDEKVC